MARQKMVRLPFHGRSSPTDWTSLPAGNYRAYCVPDEAKAKASKPQELTLKKDKPSDRRVERSINVILDD